MKRQLMTIIVMGLALFFYPKSTGQRMTIQGSLQQKKGTKFIVTGRIQTGYYDKDGSRVYTTDVIVENLEFAESKNASSGSDSSDDGFTNIPDDAEMPFH